MASVALEEEEGWSRAICSFLHVTPPRYWSSVTLLPDAQQDSRHAFGSLSLKNHTIIVWGPTCHLLVLILWLMESYSASSLLRLQFSGNCLFSSGTFRVSAFTFMAFEPFGVYFYVKWWTWVYFIICMWTSIFLSTICWRWYLFSRVCSFHLLQISCGYSCV